VALDDNKIGVNISGINISNLRFADDICLAARSNNDLQQLGLVDKVYTTTVTDMVSESVVQRLKCSALVERSRI